MRFFHLSDLHIGKQLHYYNLKEDQERILSQVVEAAREYRPDVIVIAGDIYDKSVPSAVAVSIFNRFLTEISDMDPAIPVLIIAGNHDSAQRLEYASSILDRHQIHIAGMPPSSPEERLKKIALKDEWGNVNFYLLPFVKPWYVRHFMETASVEETVRALLEREKISVDERNVIVSHQFYTSGGKEPKRSDSESIIVGGLDNVDTAVLEAFDYAALGHIHRSQSIGCGSYCGTLLPYSVQEAEDEKTLVMVELGKKGETPKVHHIPLHPLRKIRRLKGNLEEVLGCAPEEKENYVSVTVTDEIEPYHMRERLEEVFPYLLEVRVDNTRTRNTLEEMEVFPDITDPVEAFAHFFREIQGREMNEEERKILEEQV